MTGALPAELFEVKVEVAYRYGPGYLLQFTTWENDADHFQTWEMSEVQTLDDVNFWVALAKLFSSTNSASSGMGNTDVDHDTLVEVIQELLEQHPNVSKSIVDELTSMFNEESEGELHDFLYSHMLGNPVDYEFNFCRVVEKVVVQLVQPMIVDIQTVRI